MNKCNIFKPLSSPTGEFLMFSQYTDDLTHEESGKSTYRVVPSKFVALNIDLNRAVTEYSNPSTGVETRPTINVVDGEVQMSADDKTITGFNSILAQIFQSYYENSISFCREALVNENVIDGRTKEQAEQLLIGDSNNPFEFTNELLWDCLNTFKLIHYQNIDDQNEFRYIPEVKYIGDINIHSNRNVDGYNYDEIFCYIPTEADEYKYHLDSYDRHVESNLIHISGPLIQVVNNENKNILGWTDSSYPTGYPISIRNIVSTDLGDNNTTSEGYCLGREWPILDFRGDQNATPVPIHNETDENTKYNVNAIIIYYDVLHSEPGEDPEYLHRNRPMGIYFTGDVETIKNEDEVTHQFNNEIIKHVSNNDAYGQGSSFGLRIMSRYVPTPNGTIQTINTTTETGDYESIAESMGRIADALVDIAGVARTNQELAQTYKDHLAQFRNNRVNVPYTRSVAGKLFWFVNGRNTGVPVQPTRITITTDGGDETCHIMRNGMQVENTVQEMAGDIMMLTATPGAGYVFVEWEDGSTDPIRYISGVTDRGVVGFFGDPNE